MNCSRKTFAKIGTEGQRRASEYSIMLNQRRATDFLHISPPVFELAQPFGSVPAAICPVFDKGFDVFRLVEVQSLAEAHMADLMLRHKI